MSISGGRTNVAVEVDPLLDIDPATLAPAITPAVPEDTDHDVPLVQVRFGRRQRLLLYIADLFSLALGPWLASHLLTFVDPTRAGDVALRHMILTGLCTAVALHLHGMYRRPASRLLPTAWWRTTVVLRALPTAALLSLAVSALTFPGPRVLTLTAAVAMVLPTAVLVPLGRRIVVRLFGPPAVTRVLILGTGGVAERVSARLRRCRDTSVIGFVDDAPANGFTVVGRFRDLPKLCRDHDVDRIIVAFSSTPSHEVLAMIRRLNGSVPISVVPRLFELHSWRSEIEELHGLALLHVPPAHLGVTQRVAKRALDVVVGGLVALVLLPACFVMGLLIKIDSRGPVFFRQERVGRGGQPFRIFKFRTMVDGADARRGELADGVAMHEKSTSDTRVTRAGRVLRKTSLDELPQLLNVLRGEMSLVGPRPFPVDESRRLDGAALTRFDVAPGMTGLWQVSGRSDLTYADLQHLDSVYVRSWSLLWDLKIIRDTPRSVLGARGAY